MNKSSSVCRRVFVGVVATGGEWGAIAAVVKGGFGFGEGIDIEAVGVEVGGQIAFGAEVDDGLVAGLCANLQQALDDFQRRKRPNWIAICRHFSLKPPSAQPFDARVARKVSENACGAVRLLRTLEMYA